MKYIKIFSDSQAAILALANTSLASKIVKQTIENINKLAEKTHRVEINWIKAYVGYPGNERADELARKAAKKPITTEHIYPSWAIFKTQLKAKIFEKWTLQWTRDTAYQMTKHFLPTAM